MAYPFLCRELRRVNNAMKCRPSGPSPTFGYISSHLLRCCFHYSGLKVEMRVGESVISHTMASRKSQEEVMGTVQGAKASGAATDLRGGDHAARSPLPGSCP